MIAFTQPLRLGDWVEVGGVEGAVEEIGLMYTFIRTEDNARLVIPNEKLASDTIRNSTIRSAAKYAEVTVQVPSTVDLRPLVEALRSEVPGDRDEVFVSSLEGSPALTLRAWTDSEAAAEKLEQDLRLGALRAARARYLRMTPPRGRGVDDEIYARRRRKRKRAERKATRRRAVILALAAVFALLFVVAGAAVTGVATFGSSCDLDSLRPVQIGQNSFVYAADGSSLGSIPAERNRQPVTLTEISPWMRRATVAVEDRRFYRHGGVDYEGIARALWRDLSEGEVVEGGSTLTQQLVRNLYISRERTVERKLREACLAIQLNRKWSKQRILRSWLNAVYFGNRSYGIEAASQTYFSKHAQRPEPARGRAAGRTPAGAVGLRPVRRARRRARASEHGAEVDARQRGHHAQAVPLGHRQLRSPAAAGRALLDDPRAVLLRLRPRRADRPLRGEHRPLGRAEGLYDDQPALPARRRGLHQGDAQRTGDPASAVVSINPTNGAIRAMTSVTPGRKDNQFNLVCAGVGVRPARRSRPSCWRPP